MSEPSPSRGAPDPFVVGTPRVGEIIHATAQQVLEELPAGAEVGLTLLLGELRENAVAVAVRTDAHARILHLS